jgi:hypothetical protein
VYQPAYSPVYQQPISPVYRIQPVPEEKAEAGIAGVSWKWIALGVAAYMLMKDKR